MDKQELWEDLMFEIASTNIIKFDNREDKVFWELEINQQN